MDELEPAPELLDERAFRGPCWSAHRWVRLADGQDWAMPKLTPEMFIIYGEIDRAMRRYGAEMDAIPPCAESHGMAWVAHVLAGQPVTDRYVRSVVSALLRAGYELTDWQTLVLLPGAFTDDFDALAHVVADLVGEACEVRVYPIGWGNHTGIMFEN